MVGFRAIKRDARRRLHESLATPALYLTLGVGAVPLPVTVRLHVTFGPQGEVEGGPQYAAQIQDVTPRIVFLRSQLVSLPNGMPARNHIVSVEEGEAYRISNIRAPDDITITAEVARVSAADAAGLPVPEVV